MSLDDCAALVQKGDPDRFLAVMAAPLWARESLLPLYAFNLEVARAPWVSKEPLIAEMRLQWWLDVVEAACKDSAPPRAHEVAAPLHALIQERGLPQEALEAMITARRHDAYGEAFAGRAAFDAYIEETSAGLMWLAARSLGAPDRAEEAVRGYGRAAGIANYLKAVPDLVERGRRPLPIAADEAPELVIAELARDGLESLKRARGGRKSLPKGAAPAMLSGWQTAPLLKLALRDPASVLEGRFQLSEFSKRGRLLMQSFSSSW